MAIEEEGAQVPRQSTPLERHIQSALLAVFIGVIFWVGNTVKDNNERTIRMDSQLTALSDKFATLTHNTESAYSKSDAQRDVADAARQFDALGRRVTTLENTINGRAKSQQLSQWSR